MRLVNFFILFTALPSYICDNYWEVNPAKDHDKKYEALIVRRYYDQEIQKNVEKLCMGVVLNDRYVLTIPGCLNDTMKILIGFNFFFENIKDREIFITSDGTVYEVEESSTILPSMHDDSHRHSVLAIIRTNTRIKLDSKVSCVKLPKGLFWQYLNPIGNVTSFILPQMYADAALGVIKYSLYVKHGIRHCAFDIIKNIPIWKLSSCIKHKPKTEQWLKEDKMVGLPLVQDNILVGMKDYGGFLPNSKFFDKRYEIYINIALYARVVDLHMRDYTSCLS